MFELHERQPVFFYEPIIWSYCTLMWYLEWNEMVSFYLSYLKLSTYLCNWEIEIVDFLTHPTKQSH